MRPLGVKKIDNSLVINGYSFNDLKKKYKTPLYIMDKKQLYKNINDILNNFQSTLFNTHTIYASKALLNYKMLEICQEFKMGVDAVSLGDLYIIHQYGFDMKQVVFHGNNKSEEELSYAISNGVGIIVVDNLLELELIDELTKKMNQEVEIMIRINPHIDAHTHDYISTAKVASKFGISIDDIKTMEDIISIVRHNELIKFTGLHMHIGSSIFDFDIYYDAILKIVDFINFLNNDYHISLTKLNIGGGFGVPYTKNDKVVKIGEYMEHIITYLEDAICTTNSLISDVYIEPGRSIVATAGMTLYTASQIKHTEVKDYLFIDGGMTDNIRKALYNAEYTMEVVNKVDNEKEIKVDVVGGCCESGDIIIEDALIPNIDRGDLVVVYTTGAYNYSMFSNYNSHLKPAMILVGDEIELVSKREELKDLIRLFK